jgi:ATP-dependent RNA helicase RhlE
MNFKDFKLTPAILDAVKQQGYQTPTPIQEQAIPVILEGHDIMAAAQTGTGKTAGFTLPILELLSKGPRAKANQARTLILTPTRELAAQVADSVMRYGKELPLNYAVVFGGVSINPQMMKLRRGVDILVATPGRLLDLYNQNAVKFKQLEILVLDEADRMLDMGFIHDIKKIISLLPKKRQNMLFSATFSNDIRKLAKTLVHNPTEISVSPRNTTAKNVEQWIHPVDKKRKSALLLELLNNQSWQQVLVFRKTKRGANQLTQYLEKNNIKALAIHGNKSQGARTKALAAFKNNTISVLVATDIAARGIDIDGLPQVINFDLPTVAEDYVHRIGRTGRAGSSGQAISLVCADETKQLFDIEHLIKKTLARKMVSGFEPTHDIPVEKQKHRHHQNTKPKKPKIEHHDGQRAKTSATKRRRKPRPTTSHQKKP